MKVPNRNRPRREARQAEAAQRQAERNARTDAEQVAKLVAEGHEGCKEHRRLTGRK